MKKNGFSLLLIILFCLLLCFPDAAKTGAQEGLGLWYSSVVPILFPFLILSNLMVSHDSFFWFLRPLFVLKKWIPSLEPWYFHSLILGFFCGFPMGAKSISDLMDAKKISSKEGTFLLPLVNQPSPMFLAGYLGISILEGRYSIFQILCFIYLPPLVLFFLFLLFPIFKGKEEKKISTPSFLGQKNSMSSSMEHTILHSFSIIVTIGVYMMLFSICNHLLHQLFPRSLAVEMGSCFLEFSTGLHQLKNLSYLSLPVKDSLLFALASFGGFCTAAQTGSILNNKEISLFSYLLGKWFIAFLVFLLSYSSSLSS